MKNELSLTQRLESEEQVIDRGLQTFVEVGKALANIRDQKLWMAGGRYEGFEHYCKQRWGWERSYANRIAQHGKIAARIENGLGAIASGEKSTIVDKPSKASHVAPLAKLPESEQPEAWAEAVEESKAEGKTVTAAKVQEVVERRTKPAEAKRIDPDEWQEVEESGTPEPPQGASQAAEGGEGESGRKLKNGRESVTRRDREAAYKAWGAAVRGIDRVGKTDELRPHVDAIEGALRV